MKQIWEKSTGHLKAILGHEVRELRLALATRQAELRLVTEHRDELERTLRRLNSALDDAQAGALNQQLEMSGLREQLRTSESALSALRTRAEEFERSLRQAILRERESAKAQRAALARCADDMVRLEETAQAERQALENALAEQRSDSMQRLDMLAAVSASAARHQAQLNWLQHSVWWKVFAPLRRVLRAFGRRDGWERAELAQITELRSSRWFDGDWYLQNNPDVARLQLDPAVHFLRHGAVERRDPGPDFDTCFYMANYLDVTASGLNPLIHFMRHGKAEGRRRLPAGREGAQR